MAYFTGYSVLRRSAARLTSIVYCGLFFLSAVVYPLLASMIGSSYQGMRYVNIGPSEIEMAIFLLAYSFLVGSLFVFCASAVSPLVPVQYPLRFWLKGSKLVYATYMVLALGVYLVAGRGTLSLFGLGVTRKVAELSALQNLARQVGWVGVAVLCLLILDYGARRYRVYRKARFFAVALVATALLVGTVVGDRRSVQLFTSLLCLWFLAALFPDKHRYSIGIVILTLVPTLALTTAGRLGTSVLRASAWTAQGTPLATLTRYVQVYFAGVDSVATGLSFAQTVNLDWSNLFFDFGRATFGLSFLLKGAGLITSEVYNNFLYFGSQSSGQLLFAPAYGALYFGLALSPLVIVGNLYLSFLFERLMRSTTSLELAFLFGYCFMRISTNLLVNTPTIINVVTMQLGTLGLVVLCALLFRRLDKPFLRSTMTERVSVDGVAKALHGIGKS